MVFEACSTAVVAPRADPASSARVLAGPPIYALPVRSASSGSALSRLDAMPYAAFLYEECVDLFIMVTSFVINEPVLTCSLKLSHFCIANALSC